MTDAQSVVALIVFLVYSLTIYDLGFSKGRIKEIERERGYDPSP